MNMKRKNVILMKRMNEMIEPTDVWPGIIFRFTLRNFVNSVVKKRF